MNCTTLGLHLEEQFKVDARAETVNLYKFGGRFGTNWYKVVQKTSPEQAKVVQISGLLFGSGAKTVIYCMGAWGRDSRNSRNSNLYHFAPPNWYKSVPNATICTTLLLEWHKFGTKLLFLLFGAGA